MKSVTSTTKTKGGPIMARVDMKTIHPVTHVHLATMTVLLM